jgi:hypothetical protein
MKGGCSEIVVDNSLVDACAASIKGDVFDREFLCVRSCKGEGGGDSSSNPRTLESIAHTEYGGGGM